MPGGQRYNDGLSGVLDATGNATVQLRSCPPSHEIDIDEIRIDVGGAITPSAELIHGIAAGPLVIDGTQTGAANKSSPANFTLHPGEPITVKFRNGQAAAPWLVTVRGTIRRQT